MLARVGIAQPLLSQFGGRVDVARVEPVVLRHRLGCQVATALWARRLEVARLQVGCRPWTRAHHAVQRASVASLAVHDHARWPTPDGQRMPRRASLAAEPPWRSRCGSRSRRRRRSRHPGPPLRLGGTQHRPRATGAATRSSSRTSRHSYVALRSSPTGMPSCAAGSRSSTTSVSCPAATNSSTMCEPMKPAPPVIEHFHVVVSDA